MNLKSLFNKKYFIQNVLKSKAILALIISIVPILNAIFLLSITKPENSVVSNLNMISILNIIGMYVFPVAISICLLGYVFNKKSTDFINSMPLTKRQIFTTNTIGGILIILCMMVINTLVIALESLVIPNLVVTFKMLIDYFIVWTVAYIFVFTATNIAIALSGNMITSIIVVALILLLVPFMHFYITGFDGMLGNSTPELVARNASYERKIYEIRSSGGYTLPFNYLTIPFTTKVETYNVKSIIKMLVLSIVYILFGTYIFEKRKMEINETSFKSTNIHMLVKSLTMIPIVTFYLFVKEGTSNVAIDIFFFVLLVIYSLIYDLITSKNIKNIKLGIVYFLITVVLCFGMYNLVKKMYNRSRNISEFDVSSINEIALNVQNVDFIQKDEEKFIYTDNKEVVDSIKDLILRDDDGLSIVDVRVKSNKKEYETKLHIDYEEYFKLMELYLKDSNVIKEYKNINYDELLTIKLGDILVQGDKKQELTNKIKEVINKKSIDMQENLIEDLGKVTISTYENHKEVNYTILADIDYSILEDYIKLNNESTSKKIKNKDIGMIYGIYKYSGGNIQFASTDANKLEQISQIIKSNLDSLVDVRKSIVTISGVTKDFYKFTFYMNETEEIKDIISESLDTGGVDYE